MCKLQELLEILYKHLPPDDLSEAVKLLNELDTEARKSMRDYILKEYP